MLIHDEKKVALWRALSTLFLDTENDNSDYDYILRVIAEGDFSHSEAWSALENDVAPACAANLFCVAGEWAYFDEDWLLERIYAKRFNTDSKFYPLSKYLHGIFYRGHIKDEWCKIMSRHQETKQTSKS